MAGPGPGVRPRHRDFSRSLHVALWPRVKWRPSCLSHQVAAKTGRAVGIKCWVLAWAQS